MSDAPYIIEIPGLLRNKINKKIVFEKEGLTIEKTNSFIPGVFIPAEDINSFRFGVNWIRGYKFTFGRQYIIQVQDFNNNITSIKLGSYYQIRRKAYSKIWVEIFEQLWQYYFINSFNYYIELYKINQEFEIAGIKFQPFGISWHNGNLFWNEIALSNYQTYFMIHHRDNVKKNVSLNFKNDWNSFILQCVLKEIVKEQNSYRSSAV